MAGNSSEEVSMTLGPAPSVYCSESGTFDSSGYLVESGCMVRELGAVFQGWTYQVVAVQCILLDDLA